MRLLKLGTLGTVVLNGDFFDEMDEADGNTVEGKQVELHDIVIFIMNSFASLYPSLHVEVLVH